jgi:hypothetical protein
MAWTEGTVTCQCYNVMGMPCDKGTCTICGEEKSFFGSDTLSRLVDWAKEHSRKHGK